jgi:hypothetical protein
MAVRLEPAWLLQRFSVVVSSCYRWTAWEYITPAV